MTLSPLGDSAIVVSLGDEVDEATLGKVRGLTDALREEGVPGIVDVVPAFAQVTVFYDPVRVSYDELGAALRARAENAAGWLKRESARTREIPVCYGGDFGPDIADVATRAGLSSAEVIALHTGGNYRVHAIGFAPGFAYLGGLAAKLHTPRRASPRTAVPAGTVGIGGAQTGVYPLATPGGWNLIGRTPLRLFDAHRAEAAWLQAGDRVVFRAISAEEFAAWK